MAVLPENARTVVEAGALAQLVTRNPDGGPRQLANVARDPRLSIEAAAANVGYGPWAA